MQIRLHPEYVLEVLVDLRPNSTGIVLGTLVRASKKWETFYLSVTNTAPICSEEEGGRGGEETKWKYLLFTKFLRHTHDDYA